MSEPRLTSPAGAIGILITERSKIHQTRAPEAHYGDQVDSVYVFEVEDADADWWRAEVAVAATSRQAALRLIRQAGLRRKQIARAGMPVRTESLCAFGNALDVPGAILRRRDNDSGWTEWELVPPDVSLNWRISGEVRPWISAFRR